MLEPALTASLVDLLGGDGHAQTSRSSPLLISRTSSFHSACESRTVFLSSPIVTPWSVISTAGQAVQAGHSVNFIGSILTRIRLSEDLCRLASVEREHYRQGAIRAPAEEAGRQALSQGPKFSSARPDSQDGRTAR